MQTRRLANTYAVLIHMAGSIEQAKQICREFCYRNPSAERAALRSATPRGFARAVFLANARVE